MPIDNIGHFRLISVSAKTPIPFLMPTPRMKIEIIAAIKIAVPPAERGSNLNTASIGVGWATMGAAFNTY